MQEASETQCWLEFALACGYISSERFSNLDNDYERIIAMLLNLHQTIDLYPKNGYLLSYALESGIYP